jgi:ABC-2 type transport system permease protein
VSDPAIRVSAPPPSSPALGATVRETVLLLGRLARRAVRIPAATLPNLLISLFFLLVYQGLLGHASAVARLVGGNYVNFILPVSILSASVSGGTAGLVLVADAESGYLRRLLAMPISRAAIVIAPILIGALQVLLQAALLLAVGAAIGADPRTGAGGVLVLLGYALLWGLGFSGYSVATGLRTGNAQIAQTASFIFFPLIFLAPTFLPLAQLSPALRAIARINPTTYVLQAMRTLLISGWHAAPLLDGLAAGGGFAAITLALAVLVARRETARR